MIEGPISLNQGVSRRVLDPTMSRNTTTGRGIGCYGISALRAKVEFLKQEKAVNVNEAKTTKTDRSKATEG